MTLKRFSFNLIATAMVMGFAISAHGQSAQQVKSDSLKYLQDLRSQNVRRMAEIDQSISRKMEDTAPAQIEAEVNPLQMAKREHALRQEFLDRLIFQIDTKFIGGDMKQFLEASLVAMAKIDASNSEKGIWKFMKYASDAIRRVTDQKENILSFLEGYMNRSVSNPVKPEEYISSRNYTNGAVSEAGRPVGRDVVGAIADQRIREANAAQPQLKPAAPAEQKVQ